MPNKGSDDRVRILVVDDEEMIRTILTRALGAKFRVTAVDGPKSAWHELEFERFELVMTDINMPGGSGLALASEIQQRLPGLQIAFLAAVIDEETHARIEAMGATLFVKPFDLVELVAMVETLVRNGPS